MSGAKADAELRSKTDNLERMITEVICLLAVITEVVSVVSVTVSDVHIGNLLLMMIKHEGLDIY